MRFSKSLICAVVLVSLLLLLGACYYHGPHHPPHGDVIIHGGIDMVFDSGLGLYIVTGYPECFFFGGRYYRYHAPYWEYSHHIRGPWRIQSYESLPGALRGRHEYIIPPGRGRGAPVEIPGRGRGRGQDQGQGRGRGQE